MLIDVVKQLLPVFIVNLNVWFSSPHTVLIHGHILFFLQVSNSVGDNCTPPADFYQRQDTRGFASHPWYSLRTKIVGLVFFSLVFRRGKKILGQSSVYYSSSLQLLLLPKLLLTHHPFGENSGYLVGFANFFFFLLRKSCFSKHFKQ